MIRCIQRQETDPYFNLAAEEFLLKSATSDMFMTWRNLPSVVIGKHQNAFREINHNYTSINKLPVIRRITGGGTVYHDPGNVNYSFIYTGRKDNLIDFRTFTEPVILFLQSIGLKASFEGKNNITVDGFKVSGNSAHLYKNKVLHHGTLLFSTDLAKLELAIASREELYRDKAVRSIRSKVANVSDLMMNSMDVEEFIVRFREFIFNYFSDYYEDRLHPDEIISIRKLADEKYRDYKWNYGYSPDFEFYEYWNSTEQNYTIRLSVKEGIIRKAELTGPETHSILLKKIEDSISGSPFEIKTISERCKKLTFIDANEVAQMNQILQKLFKNL
jgi:lipoate---protein ligase